jgi:glycosyltransferase involved in cell wall biosynthesis
MLAAIETHPIQYHAPVYRVLQRDFGIPVTAIYGSDFSVAGYRDAEFGSTFAWDTGLLSGYTSVFLERVAQGGARSPQAASTRGLAQALHGVRPGAVLLVGYSPRFHQLAFLQAARLRRPLLLRAETTDHALRRGTLKALVRDEALRWLYQRCTRLMYVGRRSIEHFRRLGCHDDKLVFSPYCVDTTPFQLDDASRQRLRGATRSELGIRSDERVLLLSGKLVRRKRPDLLLKAIRELPAEQRSQVHVLVLGSGDRQPELEALAREDPMIRMTCLGFQNQSRLSAYYHSADLLVLPSESGETWGLVVNEALHHGLPCVVSDAVGSGPDLIQAGRTGDVFESGSVSALARALERAWSLMADAGVRERCRQCVAEYSVERAAEGVARAYFEAVGHVA